MWFLALRNKQFHLTDPDSRTSTCDPNEIALANILTDSKWQGQRIICSSSVDFPEDGGLSPKFRADPIIRKAIQIAYATDARKTVAITKTVEVA